MVGALIMSRQAWLVDKFTAFGSICRGDFIFGKDGRKRAFGHAGPAVDAGVGVDVHHRPTICRLSGDNALHRAYFDATTVTNT
jgi:hypothetical protein